MTDKISGATFDILERLSKEYPWLKGHYARGTGGVDVNTVVAVLWNALTEARRNDPSSRTDVNNPQPPSTPR